MPRRKKTDIIASFLEDLWKQAQAMLGRGKAATEKTVSVARHKLDIYLLAVRRQDLLAQLGRGVYEASRRRKPSARKQARVVDIIHELRELDAQEKSLAKAAAKEKRASAGKYGRRRGRPPGRKNKRGRKVGRPAKAKSKTAEGTAA